MPASLILWATTLGFAAGAVICWLMVVLIRIGRFPRNSWLGIHTDAVTQSDEAWARAHLAAAPWLTVAAICATCAALLGALALALGPETPAGASVGIGSIVAGLVGVGAGTLLAFVAGNRAA